MRYEPRCKHKNGYDCDICDKSYEDYKVNFEDFDDRIARQIQIVSEEKDKKKLYREASRLRNLIEEQEYTADKARIKLRKLSKGWQY